MSLIVTVSNLIIEVSKIYFKKVRLKVTYYNGFFERIELALNRRDKLFIKCFALINPKILSAFSTKYGNAQLAGKITFSYPDLIIIFLSVFRKEIAEWLQKSIL
jgi:hypothetical protein